MDIKNIWRPVASLESIQKRAELLAAVRKFFAQRGVMEVETPLLSRASIPDPTISSLSTTVHAQGKPEKYYLQTSPEFHMKRLLASGSGPIYQICKAFRNEESGRHHNPEFTILEWYQPGYSPADLMQEVSDLLTELLGCPNAEKQSYQHVFEHTLQFNPHLATTTDLEQKALSLDPEQFSSLKLDDKDSWLNLLFATYIEPNLGHTTPTFIYDYPASQAALAKVRQDDLPVAERFEVFINGLEIGNGFNELTDACEQKRRFELDNKKRISQGKPPIPIDSMLLAALENGLPSCSGIAIGLDRLLMIACQADAIEQVITFPILKA